MLIFSATIETPIINMSPKMDVAEVITEPWSVKRALARFRMQPQDLEEVAYLAAAAKNESVSLDPVNAPGILAYIYGTRALRSRLLRRGWEISRDRNVEAVLDPLSGSKIVYQNVDSACDPAKEPRAISAKGAAAEQMIEQWQSDMFPELVDEVAGRLLPKVWFFCVEISDSRVRAELSCPLAVEGGQFKGFIERIFVVSSDAEQIIEKEDDESDAQDFEIEVTRKDES